MYSKKNILLNCGYNTDREMLHNSLREELGVYDFKPGETIADIGFGSGWLEGVIINFYDSLNIYAQDIDKYNIRTADYVFKKYLELRPTPNTNKITVVKGKKDSTGLPKNHFDKIIIRETFHHFKEKEKMLQDIAGLLKTNGRLFILEPVTEETYFNNTFCKTFHYNKKDIEQFFSAAGFKLISEHRRATAPWWDDRNLPMVIYGFELVK
jgi:ubiquinone/menaquinone biosynthesis C-methylase UbiE